MNRLENVLSKIETTARILNDVYGELLDDEGLLLGHINRNEVPSHTAEALEELSERITLPEDFLAALRRGFAYPSGYFEDPHVSVGLDFVGAETILRDLDSFRSLGVHYEDEPAAVEFYRTGMRLVWSSPIHLSLDGVFVHTHEEVTFQRIASSFTEFLEMWVEHGCFHHGSYASFKRYADPHLSWLKDAKPNAWTSR